MKPRSGGRDVYRITSVGPFAGGRQRVRRRRRWPWAVGLVLVGVLTALALGRFAWPSGAVDADSAALARVSRPGLGGALKVSVHTAEGTTVPAIVRADGTVWPTGLVAPGTPLVVEADFKRPGWIGWLAGSVQHVTFRMVTPSAKVKETWLRIKPGGSLAVRFTGPVREVVVGGSKPRHLRLRRLQRTVWLGHLGDAGSIPVSGAARIWEEQPTSQTVTWFPAGGPPRVVASPRPGARIGLDTPIRLTLSEPLDKLFHGRLPWLGPASTGAWHAVDEHTLVYRPRGYGYGLDTDLKLRLPVAVVPVATGAAKRTRLLTWTTPTATQLRLQQVLARLGYLPLTWAPNRHDAAPTPTGQIWAAQHPPDGRFAWRFSNVPSSLVHLWKPGEWNVVTRGAVMTFQSSHDLLVDGYAGRDFWKSLIEDAVAGKRSSTSDYNYVLVHRDQSPQSLVLWHNGQTILTSPANTGIPKAPTALGTFPVYSHLRQTTMSGTNPDGTQYHDPGVPWVSYFNGGDAIHGFNRASYGSAQSLGCVESPFSEAERVFPYTPVGTLVTVSA